ncbi:putative damage-inducible protein DinB [Deinococcus metalli]|uniref:Putative damage-inducible protein DinB n=1 Tax=Deinococcus metalli TaxID=1141878 RepID=A0A7W8NMZ4_9DEIO|nr:DUF664 domain-containing protein [Deinococcus metalli]MBB5376339.1 putative damage-inducible protein DinB [Deinococcus metalli]GHF39026.1 hypothetical protein GCM10017781_14430 [Deinococcus metalli]
MLPDDLKTLLLRDLASVQRELDLYPDDAAVWQEVPSLPNSAGTLALHLAGGTRHFFGTVMAGSDYVRQRDAEFSRRGVARSELAADLAAAMESVRAAFERLNSDDLDRPFPVVLGDGPLSTRLTLLHLVTHLAYHLGQIDSHRRVVTGSAVSAGTLLPPRP